MCSVQEEGATAPEKKSIGNVEKKCMKCGGDAIIVIRLGDPFCVECFQTYSCHKFRSSFGKAKIVQHTENVLLAFSGGPASAALLHCFVVGTSGKAYKKLGFNIGVVYIDEGAVLNLDADQRLSNTEEVIALIKTSGFPYLIYSLEDALYIGKKEEATTPDVDDLSDGFRKLRISEERSQCLYERITSFKSLTGKEDFIRQLRRNLLLHIASKHNYTKVALAESATRLSINLISNFAIGRGGHAPFDMSFADNRVEDTMFIRPLREFSSKEVAYYNRLNDVQSVIIPNLSTKVPTKGSIQRLTEDFVNGLQTDFPSTVPTVFRTGTKMSLGSHLNTSQDNRCAMCQAPIDTNSTKASAVEATEFSLSLSKKSSSSSSSCSKTDECCGEGDGSCHSNASVPNLDEVLTRLCYGCRLIARELKSSEFLPDFVIQEASYRCRRSQMKESIADFLIEPDT